MSNSNSSSVIGTFFEDYGLILVVIAIPISGLLCILQLVLSLDNMFLLILALAVFGLALVGFAIGTFFEGMFNFGFILMFIVGVAVLVLAYFLAFEPDSSVTQWFRNIYRPEVAALEEEQLEIILEIEPHQYQSGETGSILISFENLSEHTLVLNSVMFETQNQFFEGFVVDYNSADPSINDRKEKLGNTTALIFSEEEMIIPPGEKYLVKVEIVASQPGDYSDTFYVFPEFDTQESEALGMLLDHEEEINIVIFPRE